MSNNESIDYLFHPRSIAIVGASSNPSKQGYRYLRQLLTFGFPGKLYPVNPHGGEILGLKVYPSISEIPDPVGCVISVIPAPQVLPLLKDCASKGVKVVVLYTAHLGETGKQEDRELENQIISFARKAGIRILGPNCMGVYYPRGGLTFRFNWSKEPGNISFISQSAGHTADVVYRGSIHGLRFSKVISYGNACDINETDLLYYLGKDPETEFIAAYIEGVRDEHFPQVLREVAKKKPVIFLKGGYTEGGARATFSHTGSLAGSGKVWEALLSQCGAISVYSVEELVDLLLAFAFLPPPQGRNVGAIGAGGGGSVLVADEFERRGLWVPPLPEDIIKQIQNFLGEDWILVKNPVDTSVLFPSGWGFKELTLIFQLIADHPLYHILLVDTGEWLFDLPEELYRFSSLVDVYLKVAKSSDKPTAFIIRSADCPEGWRWEATIREKRRCVETGFPVYPTITRAAQALSKFASYHLKSV